MMAVNPRILIWARQEAGIELHEAADGTGIDQNRLAKMERGVAHPSHSKLRSFAKVYRRPVLTFYLPDIPKQSDYGTDFRGRAVKIDPKERVMLEALLRNAKASQELIRATLELERETSSIEFVGSLRRSWDLPRESDLMDRVLKQASSGKRHRILCDALRALERVLGAASSRAAYRAQANPKAAFKLLRSACERVGVFVILKGNLGSHHSALSTDLFRAFVIADDIAPYMVINSNDSFPAQSFSILHGIVHLLLDQSGVSNSEISSPVEKFCNTVAAEWLLPSDTLIEAWQRENRRTTGVRDFISDLARQHNLSHTMVAVRLCQNGLITNEKLIQLRALYRQRWEEKRQDERERRKARNGGPSFYQVRRSHLGEGTLQFARRMIQSQNLAVTKAAVILSVKPGQVAELLKRPNKVR